VFYISSIEKVLWNYLLSQCWDITGVGKAFP